MPTGRADQNARHVTAAKLLTSPAGALDDFATFKRVRRVTELYVRA